VTLGYIFSRLTQRIEDQGIEITLTTIVAYGSYLLAQSLHLSGVIATAAAGLMIGNFGMRTGMNWRTRIALWSFWEYASFLINSILFLLIGLQVRVCTLLHMARIGPNDRSGSYRASAYGIWACSYQQSLLG
jgi:CPA1 family monovalent cation:H+ antiporter